ncbi:MAG: GNAT family N-acetyltransferase [Elusimicrobiota bacterium]
MIEIKRVETKTDLMEFISVPWTIYKNDPNWVPPLISEMKTILSEKKNPFWKHSEKTLFIALQDGKPVGRVAGVIDRNFVEFQNANTGFFAFFESVDDRETATALLDSAMEWLKGKGMESMIGPTAPSTNDEMGLLYEGYDSPPFLMMPYNPPYYHTLLKNYGMEKAKDLLAFFMDEQSAPRERLKRIVGAVQKHIPELVVRPVNMSDYKQETRRIREIYNSAWEKNWGFVPWTEEEFYSQCERMKSLILPETTLLAFVGDRPVGMLIGVPDYNEVLKKLNGRLGPLEIVKFLWYKRKIKTMRILIMGVIKEYRNRGIEGAMYQKIIENGFRLGFRGGEFSWILEDNIMMCRAAEMLGGNVYKRYRVYEMRI